MFHEEMKKAQATESPNAKSQEEISLNEPTDEQLFAQLKWIRNNGTETGRIHSEFKRCEL